MLVNDSNGALGPHDPAAQALVKKSGITAYE
jgi:hypothetical protein